MIVIADERAVYDPDSAIIIDIADTLEEAIEVAKERGDNSVVVETDNWHILWWPYGHDNID